MERRRTEMDVEPTKSQAGLRPLFMPAAPPHTLKVGLPAPRNLKLSSQPEPHARTSAAVLIGREAARLPRAAKLSVPTASAIRENHPRSIATIHGPPSIGRLATFIIWAGPRHNCRSSPRSYPPNLGSSRSPIFRAACFALATHPAPVIVPTQVMVALTE